MSLRRFVRVFALAVCGYGGFMHNILMTIEFSALRRRLFSRDTASARAWVLFACASLLLAAVSLLVAQHLATRTALEALERQGRADAGLKVALLRAVLERPRSLPLILSRDREVEEAHHQTKELQQQDFPI